MRLFGKEKQSEQERRDEALRKKLEGHELTPPSYLWEAIEEKLPEAKGRRPGALLYYVLPIAACIIAAIVLFTVTGTEGPSEADIIAGKPHHAGTEGNIADRQAAKKSVPADEAPSEDMAQSRDGQIAAREESPSVVGSDPFKKTGQSAVTENETPFEEEEERKVVETPENPFIKDIPFVITGEDKPKDEVKLSIIDTTPADVKNGRNTPLVKQDNPKSGAGKWMAGVRVSPAYSFRFAAPSVKMDQMTSQIPSNEAELIKHERGGTGFGIAVLGRYALSKNLSILTGLEYNRSTIHSHIKENYYRYIDSSSQNEVYGSFVETSIFGDMQNRNAAGGDPDFTPLSNPPAGLSDVYEERMTPVTYQFNVFEIPVELRGEFIGKHIGWFVEGGPRLRLMQGYYLKVYESRNGPWQKGSVSGIYHTVQAGAHLHTGILVPFRKFNLEAGPYFSTMLTALHDRGSTRLYQAGGSLTAWYKF